ncbi:MAG: amidohydrolase family protein [Bacteroidota bacterium]
MQIDAHQHFWSYDPQKHAWIDDSMAKLKRDFLPDDLWQIYQANGIDGCVAVQADQSEAETDFLLQLAAQHDFIKGVVGWVDLRADTVEERLAHYAQFPKLKGFRHVVQDEPDPNFMLRTDFQRGISLLQPYQFTYDILIFPTQLEAAIKTVRQFPAQQFVLDHIAKPYIKKGEIEVWRDHIQELANHPNVYCKISGMVTEADWNKWTYEDFVPYLDVVFHAFGTARILFGSDWPVCLLGGSYQTVKSIVDQYVSQYNDDVQASIFGANAAKFYRL